MIIYIYTYIYICKWLANVYLLLACCLNVRDRSKVSFVKPQWNLRDLVILKFKKGGFESSMSMDFMVIYGDLMGFNGIWIRLMVNLWWFNGISWKLDSQWIGFVGTIDTGFQGPWSGKSMVSRLKNDGVRQWVSDDIHSYYGKSEKNNETTLNRPLFLA